MYIKILITLLLIGAASAMNAQMQPGDRFNLALDTMIDNTSDTTEVDTLEARYNTVYCVVVDTGTTYTDSIFFEVYNKKLSDWVRVGAKRLIDNVYTTATNQAGVTSIYEINHEAMEILRRRLSQRQHIAGRRSISQIILINR